MTFQNFLGLNKIYNPNDIEYIADVAMNNERLRSKKKVLYFDTPCAFDIETTSFISYNGEKTAIMYEWTLGLNGLVIIGRTWEQFLKCIEKLIECLNISLSKRLVIYVHNLAYEFQFICKRFEWDKVFAIDNRKPVYATTIDGIEFRCSYLLSGYALVKLAQNLTTIKIEKLVGDLDYSLMRHSETPLTIKEKGYCVNDVKIVMAYIYERIQLDGGITRIPLTKTGYVRQYCRRECFKNEKSKKYKKNREYYDLMNELTIEPEEYKQLKRAFQGGFTHANPFYSGKEVENVGSDDFTSSYPCVMVAEMFPMSKAEIVYIKSKEDLEYNLKYYCCLFDAEFINIDSKVLFDNYISISRCWDVEKPIVNNGRLVSAKRIRITLTEQDYNIIKVFYRSEHFGVSNFRRYKKSYLPTPLVKSILKLYSDKTTLKGVDGKEVEYLQSKEQLNSCYGMMVTDIVRDSYIYANEWLPDTPDFNTAIEKYNNSSNRFLFYPWGVWVTAYARRNLFTGIIEFKEDYIYSDTDSIKTVNRENHIKYINAYNEMIRNRLYKAMDFHCLSHDLIEPKTVKGEKKCLGVWDFEGYYTRFKTLGAKRYMVEKYKPLKVKKRHKIKRVNGDIKTSSFKPSEYEYHVNITVSGLNKKIAVPYLKQKFGDDIFKEFKQGLYVPPEYTGKNTHTYIDNERSGVLTDYLGNKCIYHELSAVHMEGSDYHLSLSKEYVDYLTEIKTIS